MTKRGLQRHGARHSCDLNLVDSSTAAFASNKSLSHLGVERRCEALLERCEQLGYTSAAFSHTVFGKVRTERDSVDAAYPHFPQESASSCQAYRRINVVIEDLADIRLFTGGITQTDVASTKGNNALSSLKEKASKEGCAILQGYDIVALSPKNEAAFRSCCQSARGADIIMLDYVSGRGGRFPYTLRRADLQAAAELGIAFEICYGPMVVDTAKRKAFIQAIQHFRQASHSVQPTPDLLISSGSRINPEKSTEYGPLALRSSSDIANVLKEFVGLDKKSADMLMTCVPQKILDRVRNGRKGFQGSGQVKKLLPDAKELHCRDEVIGKRKGPAPNSVHLKKMKSSAVTEPASLEQAGSGGELDDVDGGFLAL